MTVTSPSSTGRGRSAAATPPGGGRAAARRSRPEPSLLGRYLRYLGYFLGTGLLSGAIVHYPLDPARYAVIAAIGAVLFLVAALAAEAQEPGRLTAVRIVAVLGTSLALSFGVGMLSGGLQHFDDFPDRGAVLIPAGLLLSFVAFTLKEARRPLRRIFGPLGIAVLVISVAGYVGLRQVAAGMPAESGDHHHGQTADEHGEEADGHDHQHDETTAPPAAKPDTAASATPTASAAAPTPATSTASPSVPPHGSPGHHH